MPVSYGISDPMDEARRVNVSGAPRRGWSLFASSLNGNRASRVQQENEPTSSLLSPINFGPPVCMPADVSGLTDALDDISSRPDIPRLACERLARDIVGSFFSAVSIGRAPDKVTILLLGGTGQGKSKTINRLVGRNNFLKTGRNESTTKDVQSVLVPIVQDGIKVTLAFDDTPGLLDTSLANRTNNAVALSRYCRSFTPVKNSDNVNDLTRLLDTIHTNYPKVTFRQHFRNAVFPNAILLTSTWRDVKKDAHNGPGRYTSALGCSAWMLSTSGLYDEERPNVVVVITRALTDPKADLDVGEDEDKAEFDGEWEKEAQLKREIIHAIQRTVYPGSKPWPIVFVENGGSRREFSVYHMLPNKEQSHQNLITELRGLFSHQGKHGVHDLLGLQALADIVSGSLGQSQSGAEVVTTIQVAEQAGVAEVEARVALRKFSGCSQAVVSPAIDALASTILGHSYNPVRNQIGAIPVICSQSKRVTSNAISDGFDSISKLDHSSADICPQNSQLQIEFDMRTVPAAGPSKGQYVAHKTIASASFNDASLTLSPEMAKIINALPPWDDKSAIAVSSYYNFFDNHGTHVVLSAAFGGIACIKGSQEAGLDEEVVVNALQNGLLEPLSDRSSGITNGPAASGKVGDGVQGVRFQYKGGRRVGPSLIHELQQLFDTTIPGATSASNDWRVARSLWVEELMEDPVFLPLSPQTKYAWLYTLDGISPEQAQNLVHASQLYLRKPKGDDLDLDRSFNVESVRSALRRSRHRFWSAIARVVERIFS